MNSEPRGSLRATSPGPFNACLSSRIASVNQLGQSSRRLGGADWLDGTFSAGDLVGKLTPVPLAAIHSTMDEFVPENDVRKLMARAGEPKRLWMVTASDHRFSGNIPEFDRRLLESIEWVRQNQPRT